MSQPDPQDTLSKIAQHLVVAQTYIGKVAVLVAEYQESIAPMPAGSVVRSSNTAIHSLQTWAEYLAENGPTTRGDLHDRTGMNLTKSGYDRTQAWTGPMTYMQDDAFPADSVLRIKGLSTGVGRPPTIYFLWSQRWSVLTLFGVGPTKPDNLPEQIYEEAKSDGLSDREAQEEAWPSDPQSGDNLTADIIEALSHPVRFDTIEEWDDYHAPTFDAMVASESKPTDDQKQVLRYTLPDGADANAAIAIAYRNAVGRSREAATNLALLGVVRPPESGEVSGTNWADNIDEIRSEHDGTPDPNPYLNEFEPEPDRSDWTMVGNHNHLPHSWSDFCAISQCQRVDGPPT